MYVKQSNFYFTDSLPTEFGNLKNLEHIALDNNYLTVLPESFSKLTNLRNLNLSKNGLTSFPTLIYNLRRLDNVDLSRNRITILPSDFEKCQAIEVNLNQNQVCTNKLKPCHVFSSCTSSFKSIKFCPSYIC